MICNLIGILNGCHDIADSVAITDFIYDCAAVGKF